MMYNNFIYNRFVIELIKFNYGFNWFYQRGSDLYKQFKKIFGFEDY